MKKYLLGLLMCVVLVALLAACGGNNNDGGTQPPEQQPPVTEVTPPTPDDPTDDWVAPTLDIPTEVEELPPGAAVANLVETPTAGRLLGRDGVPLNRAQILEVIAQQPAPAGELVIGDSTTAAGNFITGFTTEMTGSWTNELLWGGRGTMAMDFNGQWVPNPLVIRQPTEITNHPDGSRTYTFFIYTDNVFSDGTPITAIDYVFNLLLRSSPAFREIGGTVTVGIRLDGYAEFLNGRTHVSAGGDFIDENGNVITGLTENEDGDLVDADGNVVTGVPSNYFRGIRLHGPDSFSVTVHSEYLPFVWDFLYQSWGVLPFHYFNRGGELTITDTPNGVRIDGLTPEWAGTVINAPDGIRFQPTVFVGPYMIRNWDAGTSAVVLDRNPRFEGTWDGFMPQVQTIAIVDRPSATIIDSLRIGDIDMVHGQRGGVQINEGWAVVADLGLHRGLDYPRHGYGYMAWHGDHGPGQFAHVRRAMAWMLDRYDFARQFTLGFGTVQHGPYALRGWEFQTVGHELYAHPDFTHYGFNPANALAELEAGGWILNSQGEPFTPGVDRWRYKDVTGLYTWQGESVQDDAMTFQVGDRYLMRLEMIWAANDNNVSNIMRVVLPPVAEGLGMHIIEELYPAGTTNIPAWQRAPGSAYVQGADRFRAHHIYTLAVGLASPSQLWESWSLDPVFARPGFNTTWHGCWELHNLAEAMRPIDASIPGWEEKYLDLWIQFQLRYNYWMPLLPLYADDDHDFVPLWLGNWDAHGIWNFPHAVQRAYDGRTR
ncbi:MAG: ABC transporter substrate-binding protein [Firmicutes bacterium]|nr:ABC transporter substrate-binding protein [Bacillota bacterium]